MGFLFYTQAGLLLRFNSAIYKPCFSRYHMNEWACVCAGKGVAPGSGWSDCVKIARRDQVHLTAQQRQNRKTRSGVKCVCVCVHARI